MKRFAKVITPFVFFLALQACAGDEPDVSTLCNQAADHLVETRYAVTGIDKNPALVAEAEKHRKVLRDSLARTFHDQCVRRGVRYAHCLLDAKDHAATTKCEPVSSAVANQ